MITSVPEADRANLLRMAETWPRSQAETIGGKPRSIRKKGFWRAYRRGDLAILVSLATYSCMNALANDLYGNIFVPDRNVPNDTSYMIWGLSKWI